MQLMIGSQIKKFRQERKLTQEELGSLLGISFQAISKWENNLAYPDITLLPRLAQVFEVSMDELFACNLKNIQDEIESYVEWSYRLRETDPQTGRQILEEGHCTSLKTLAVTGKDLIASGMKPGKELGELLHWLLDQVLENPENNTREWLIARAETRTGFKNPEE